MPTRKGDPRLSSRKDKTCLQPNCIELQYCKGSCRRHYRQIRKGGLTHALEGHYNLQPGDEVTEANGLVWCSTCKEWKTEEEFVYWNEKKQKRRTQCRGCVRNRAYIRRYGITLKEYEGMAEAQGYKCALCFRGQDEFEYMLAVDHDHESGAVRGLLCRPCNTALERAETDGWLERAKVYLA